jgi:hypothetical protein
MFGVSMRTVRHRHTSTCASRTTWHLVCLVGVVMSTKREVLGGLMVLLAGACGASDPTDPSPDAGAPADGSGNASPTVTVRAPNGGETFRGIEPIEIAWKAVDDGGGELTYDIAVIGAGGELTPIAQGVMQVGPSAMAWIPPEVAAPTPLRIQVTVHDGTHEVSDVSDADFMVAPADAAVRFSQDLQPILSQRCAGSQCHSATASLDLTPASAYADLVGVPGGHCTAYDLVEPGAPEASYLMFKLRGTGPCFDGERMPRGATPLGEAEIALFASWIAAGALDN